MAQARERNEWREPLTPEALAGYGALPKPATEPVDAAGAWEQTWRVWLLRRSPKDTNHRGIITLKRTPTGPDTFRLEVTQEMIQASQAAVHETRATLDCAADALGTPHRWQARACLRDLRAGSEIAESAASKSGTIADGVMAVEQDGRCFTRDVPGAVTSNWSLLEALQRLARVDAPGLAFTFLDELDKVKPNHRLRFRERTTLVCGGTEVGVSCIQQLGEGTLAWLYYVDGSQRLLLAINGLRAYILDSTARDDHRDLLEERYGAGGRGR